MVAEKSLERLDTFIDSLKIEVRFGGSGSLRVRLSNLFHSSFDDDDGDGDGPRCT